MKKQIRSNVFETNSSSTHSVTWGKNKGNNMVRTSVFDKLVDWSDHFNEDRIIADFGNFGWEWEDYYDAYDKLVYLLTMAYEIFSAKWYEYQKEHKDAKLDTSLSFFQSEDFEAISDAVKNYTGYGVDVPVNVVYQASTYNGKVTYYVTTDSNSMNYYIDHQSYEDYHSIQDFLDDYGIDDIETFIFCNDVVLHTGNDNDDRGMI